jgi:hypothetical protein
VTVTVAVPWYYTAALGFCCSTVVLSLSLSHGAFTAPVHFVCVWLPGCRLVRLDPDVAASTLKGATGLYAIASYPQAVGCALVEVEGGLHMAGLCTYAGQAPPLQDDALLDFVKQVGTMKCGTVVWDCYVGLLCGSVVCDWCLGQTPCACRVLAGARPMCLTGASWSVLPL